MTSLVADFFDLLLTHEHLLTVLAEPSRIAKNPRVSLWWRENRDEFDPRFRTWLDDLSLDV